MPSLVTFRSDIFNNPHDINLDTTTIKGFIDNKLSYYVTNTTTNTGLPTDTVVKAEHCHTATTAP
jgi:hypothetical protein